VASVEECRAALEFLAAKLDQVDSGLRARHVVERSLSCTIRDIDTVFVANLRDGRVTDIELSESPRAQIRVSVLSDDLIELARGSLDAAKAMAQGKLRIDASMFDLLRLRSLL
jgi:putative sterol carrier protein